MLTQLLIWGVGEPASAAWALAIAAQTIVIIVLTNLHQRIWNPGSQRYAIDLRTLILWTTAAALAFCFMQYGREQWLWTMVVTQWQFFDFVMIHGVVNALLAVLWLWAIAAGNWKYRAVKIAMAVLLVGLLSVKLASAVTWIFGPIVYADHIWLVVVVQSILLSGTIACARIGTRRLDRGKSPSKPLTEASYVCEKGVRYQ